MRIAILTIAAATLFAGAAHAGPYHYGPNPYTPGVDDRQANQEARIGHGIANGSLTPAEARRLEAGQNRIDRMESRFKADGHVTWGERLRLHHAQDHQSRMIWRKKHNFRHR